MTRRARIVVPECPHHITQRGNRREPIFFEPGDQVTGDQVNSATVNSDSQFGDTIPIARESRISNGSTGETSSITGPAPEDFSA